MSGLVWGVNKIQNVWNHWPIVGTQEMLTVLLLLGRSLSALHFQNSGLWLSWVSRWPDGTFATRGVLGRNSVPHCRLTQLMTSAIGNKLYGERRRDIVLGLIIVCFLISSLSEMWKLAIGWHSRVPPTAWAFLSCGCCRWVTGWERKSQPGSCPLP